MGAGPLCARSLSPTFRRIESAIATPPLTALLPASWLAMPPILILSSRPFLPMSVSSPFWSAVLACVLIASTAPFAFSTMPCSTSLRFVYATPRGTYLAGKCTCVEDGCGDSLRHTPLGWG